MVVAEYARTNRLGASGKALLVSQTKLVSGTLTSAGANEAIAASKGFSRELDYAALAKGCASCRKVKARITPVWM